MMLIRSFIDISPSLMYADFDVIRLISRRGIFD